MKKLSILFLSLFVLVSCSSDDDNGGKEIEESNAKAITSFTFLAADNDALSEDFEGSINEDAKTITLVLPNGTDISALIPTIVISEEATVDPDDKKATDFGETVTYTVTAEDDSQAKYTVTVSVGESSSKMVTAFVFLAADNNTLSEDVEATIDEEANTITLVVPFGTDITALVPTITISEAAMVDPDDKKATDFGEAVIYTVTAEDDSEAKYTVTVSVEESSSKMVTAFVFLAANNNTLSEDVEATIDEGAKTITAEVPFGTELTALVPTIAISEAATVDPENKLAKDFSEAVVYTVTAADDSEKEYTVTVTVTEPTEREVLIDLYNANPNNYLAWNLEDDDISTWEGLVLENGSVAELILNDDAGIDQLPASIKYLSNLKVLNLMFNNLSDLPEEIGDLSKLELIDLSHNSFSSFPEVLIKMTNLKTLDLDGNFLTEVPGELGSLTNLESLDLGRNSLTEVPEELGNLVNLEKLFLHRNSFTSIPPELGNLTNLVTLSLYDNSLTSVPVELGNLSNLQTLSLSSNSLTSFPSELGNLTKLTTLDLSSNSLTSIPKAICDLNIQYFFKDDTAICEN